MALAAHTCATTSAIPAQAAAVVAVSHCGARYQQRLGGSCRVAGNSESVHVSIRQSGANQQPTNLHAALVLVYVQPLPFGAALAWRFH